MNKELVKKIIFYVVGLIIMILLIIFIKKGFKEMVTDQLAEEKEKQEMTSDTEEVTEEPVTEDTEITTQEIESTTEATTEITTEEVVEETTRELTTADDVKNPVFLILPSTVEIKQGNSFYVNDYVSFADDVDRSLDLTIEGNVNTDEPGTYEVKLMLEDDAGHTTNGNMKVNVVTELTPGTTKEKQDFETFKATYKNDNTSLGIDVSRWQEDVDYEAVRNAGCEFVIIRIGGYDDGSQYTDRYFKSNIEKAKAAGLKVGIYWHAEENSKEQIEDNVKYMMEALGGESLDFPIAFDWEDFSHFQKYGMNLNDINYYFEVFCNNVKAYGYDACLYSSKNFLESVWTNPKGHPVWLANYVPSTSYSGAYYMWQQSNTGRIPGVNGDVDMNVLYNDRYEQ